MIALTNMIDKDKMDEFISVKQESENKNFSNEIAHDFNNVLSAILGYAELIKVDSENSEQRMHKVDQIINTVSRGKELVNLLFKRNGNHREKMDANLEKCVKDAKVFLEGVVTDKINIKTVIQSNGLQVEATEGDIYRLLLNLGMNACEALKKKAGTISIGLKDQLIPASENEQIHPGYYAVLEVKDNGIGMPQEMTQHIFDPYFSTKMGDAASGMGLTVVMKIVNQLNGSIKVNTKVGSGTTFSVYIPAIDGRTQR